MFIPTGETPLDILLRIANIVVQGCEALVEFFSTPVFITFSQLEINSGNTFMTGVWAIIGGFFESVLGYNVTWIEFLFASIPFILVYNLIKWIVGIVTGS